MKYKDLTDYELLEQVYSCNEDANEIILYKYKPLIINIANKFIKYSHGGMDLNDLIQEGMLGLNDAINNYREDKAASFATYAKLCIERRLVSIIRSTQTYKNKILNESISFENEDEQTIDKYLADNTNNPEEIIASNDYEDELFYKLNQQLTDFEKQVFELKKNYFDYKEIAEILDKDTKAIDNAIQRIKTKLKKIMNEK